MPKKILGSVVSILCGWIAGWICLVVICFFGNHQYEFNRFSEAVWDDLGLFVLMGILIVPTWFFAFGPLYVFLPRRSFLWHSYIVTPFGALNGIIILLSPVAYSELIVYHAKIGDILSTWPLSLPAAIVGGGASLVATLTYDYFTLD